MRNEIYIEIQGTPIAKARPRFVRRGKFVSTFNPQETEEGRWLWEALPYIKLGQKIEEGPVSLCCEFVMPIPKSISKKRRHEMSKNNEPHIKKPDLDNMLKFVKDCLNGHAWKDDSQVAETKAWKYYGDQPKTRIWVTKEK